jgi:DNA-binding NtrC family response regulator
MEFLHNILVVDDSKSVRRGLQGYLTGLGYRVTLAETAEEALEVALATMPDLAIVDLNLPGRSGLEFVAALQEKGVDATVIILTGHGSIESAVQATRRGAFDYLLKPVEPEQLKTVLERALERAVLRREVQQLRREMMRSGQLQQIVGRSPVMGGLYALIDRIAPTTASVLITGESGTGKELVARTLHRLSRRSARAFVAINCAAIPATLLESEIFGHEKGAFTGATTARAGCFEQAHEGTLLLDEIGEMPTDLQSKLLRVLEDRSVRRVGAVREFQVDVRMIAATNADPDGLIRDGILREDLYYRLSVFNLHLPPLRDRVEDIPLLAERFLEEFRGESSRAISGFSESAMELLMTHRWPGNVRELRNAVQQSVILCADGEIQPENLPSRLRSGSVGVRSTEGRSITVPVGVSIAEAEEALIRETLRSYRGEKARTAKTLGISLKTLYTRLHRYGLINRPDEFGDAREGSAPGAVSLRERPPGSSGQTASPTGDP